MDSEDIFAGRRSRGLDLSRGACIPGALLHPNEPALVFAAHRQPETPKALYDELRQVVESALLLELSRYPTELKQLESEDWSLETLQLWSLDGQPLPASALQAFAFSQSDARMDEPLAARLRGVVPEFDAASAVGYRCAVTVREEAGTLDAQLSGEIGDWARPPGHMAAALCRHLDIQPTLAGFKTLDSRLISREPGELRYLPPRVFQAICDLVGVIANEALGIKLSWAQASPDDDEPQPPAAFRLPDGRWFPAANALLTWAVMPLQPGETVDDLSAWIQHAFG